MSRTYPKGARVNSSNYEPFAMWNAGTQMVALNYQTCGDIMFLNNGKFRDNGGCGWVLKPEFLLKEEAAFDPNFINPALPCKIPKLCVKVISARQLPKPLERNKNQQHHIISPHITVEIHGASTDKVIRKSGQVDKDGFSPHWDEQFTFNLMRSELDLITFAIWNHDKRIAHNAFPVEALRSGYRILALFDELGRQLPLSNLFVHISFPDKTL